MEVVEKNVDGLSREFTVKVSAAELDEKLVKRLEELKGQVHLKGFRPGKAPVSFLKKMYGKGVMGELLQETMTEANKKALEDNKLQPAMPPRPDLEDDLVEKVIEGKADLEYSLKVEVLPEIELTDVKALELTRKIAEAPQEDVDEALQNIAGENKTYKPRGKTAKAKDGDRLVIDFVGKVDGEEFDGGKAEDSQLVLGSNSFIPGFEEQLVGVKTGEEKTIEVTFPEDYGAKHLAGKAATFDVTVKEVQAPQEAKIDDDLAKNLGFDDLEALTKRVRETLENQLSGQTRMHLKREILDKLDETHSFELPKGMVEAEFEQIWQQVQSAELDDEDKDKSEEELKEEYSKIAERRVRLGLVLAEIGKENDITVSQEQLQAALQQQAMQYQMPVEQLAKIYNENPSAMAQLRAPLFEDMVVDFIIENAKVTDKKISKEELMEDPDADI